MIFIFILNVAFWVKARIMVSIIPNRIVKANDVREDLHDTKGFAIISNFSIFIEK